MKKLLPLFATLFALSLLFFTPAQADSHTKKVVAEEVKAKTEAKELNKTEEQAAEEEEEDEEPDCD